MSKITTKVLIIDDDEAPRINLRSVFESSRRRKYEVATTKDATEAESAVQSVQFDVIVVDIMLTGNPTNEVGIELLSEGMLFASCPKAVKIVITAYPTYERCVRAMRVGAWDFIPKVNAQSLKPLLWESKVVVSASDRLDELEAEAKQEALVFEEWLPKHEGMLLDKYPNQYIAIRDEHVISSGGSMISLGAALRQSWKHGDKKPFILFVAKK